MIARRNLIFGGKNQADACWNYPYVGTEVIGYDSLILALWQAKQLPERSFDLAFHSLGAPIRKAFRLQAAKECERILRAMGDADRHADDAKRVSQLSKEIRRNFDWKNIAEQKLKLDGHNSPYMCEIKSILDGLFKQPSGTLVECALWIMCYTAEKAAAKDKTKVLASLKKVAPLAQVFGGELLRIGMLVEKGIIKEDNLADDHPRKMCLSVPSDLILIAIKSFNKPLDGMIRAFQFVANYRPEHIKTDAVVAMLKTIAKNARPDTQDGMTINDFALRLQHKFNWLDVCGFRYNSLPIMEDKDTRESAEWMLDKMVFQSYVAQNMNYAMNIVLDLAPYAALQDEYAVREGLRLTRTAAKADEGLNEKWISAAELIANRKVDKDISKRPTPDMMALVLPSLQARLFMS